MLNLIFFCLAFNTKSEKNLQALKEFRIILDCYTDNKREKNGYQNKNKNKMVTSFVELRIIYNRWIHSWFRNSWQMSVSLSEQDDVSSHDDPLQGI